MPIATIANSKEGVGMSLINLIINIKNLCSLKEEAIREELDLSLAEYNCLSIIDAQEKISCNDLSIKLGLSSSRGSRIIDSLVNKNYLLRNENSTDRRSKTIKLAQKGAMLKENIEALKNECEEKLVASLPKSNYERIQNSLEEIINILSKEGVEL